MSNSINNIKLTRHGFHQSSSYVFATFSFDKNVLLLGENNAGKTSALNSLQLQLLPEENLKSSSRKFKFKASADGKSYSDQDTYLYYFPDEDSYIISEFENNSGVFCVILYGTSLTDKKYDRKIIQAPYIEIQKLLYDSEQSCSLGISREEFFITLEKQFDTKTLKNKKQIKDSLFTIDTFSKNSSPFNLCPLKNGDDTTFNLYSILLKAVYDTQSLGEKELNELVANIVFEKHGATQTGGDFNVNQRRAEYSRLKTIKDKIEQLDSFSTQFSQIEQLLMGKSEQETEIKWSAKNLLSACAFVRANSEAQMFQLQTSLDKLNKEIELSFASIRDEESNNGINNNELLRLSTEHSRLQSDIDLLIRNASTFSKKTIVEDDLLEPLKCTELENVFNTVEQETLSTIRNIETHIESLEDQELAERKLKDLNTQISSNTSQLSNYQIQLSNYTEMIHASELFSESERNILQSIPQLSDLSDLFLKGGTKKTEIVEALQSLISLTITEDGKVYFEGNPERRFEIKDVVDRKPTLEKNILKLTNDIASFTSEKHQIEKIIDPSINKQELKLDYAKQLSKLSDIKKNLATAKGTLLSLGDIKTKSLDALSNITRIKTEIIETDTLISEIKASLSSLNIEKADIDNKIKTHATNQLEYSDILDEFESASTVFYPFRNIPVDTEFSQSDFDLTTAHKNLRTLLQVYHKEMNEAHTLLKPFILWNLIDDAEPAMLENSENHDNLKSLFDLLRKQMINFTEEKNSIFNQVDAFKHETSLEMERVSTMKQELSHFANSINNRLENVSISDLKSIRLRIDFNRNLIDKFELAKKRINTTDFNEYVGIIDEIHNFQHHHLSHGGTIGHLDLLNSIEFEAKYDSLGEWIQTKQSNGTNSMILIVFISFLLDELYKPGHDITFPIIMDEFSKISIKNTLSLFAVINSYNYIVAGATPQASSELLNCFEKITKVDSNIASEYRSSKRKFLVLEDSPENSFRNTRAKLNSIIHIDLTEDSHEQRHKAN